MPAENTVVLNIEVDTSALENATELAAKLAAEIDRLRPAPPGPVTLCVFDRNGPVGIPVDDLAVKRTVHVSVGGGFVNVDGHDVYTWEVPEPVKVRFNRPENRPGIIVDATRGVNIDPVTGDVWVDGKQVWTGPPRRPVAWILELVPGGPVVCTAGANPGPGWEPLFR